MKKNGILNVSEIWTRLVYGEIVLHKISIYT